MGTEEVVENMSMNDGENLGSQTTDIGHRTVYEGLLNTSVEDANNYVTYRTDYLNLADDSFIGSIIGSSSTDIYTSPLSTAPDVLEIVTTVMVTKASPAFFKKFKEENRIDTRIQQDFVVQGFEFGYVKKVEMIVHSQKLVDALRAIIEYYPGSSLFATDQVKINEPFAEILHYRDEIEAYKNQHPPTHSPDYIEATNQHIDILLLYIDQRYGKELEAERQRHRKSPPTCTYQMLWLLFKPGELCYYYPALGQLQAIITKNLKTPLQIGEYVAGSTHLFGWSVSYGGKTFGREPFDKAISNFVGEKEIATLECYPARYFVQHGSITHAQMQERLIARGRKYWEMSKPTYSDYGGTTAYFPYRQINGRIMVDSMSCFEAHPLEYYGDPTPLDRPVLLHVDAEQLYRIPRYKGAKDWVLEGTSLDDMAQQRPGCNCAKCGSNVSMERPRGRFWGYYQCDPKQSSPPNESEYFLLCSYRTFAFDLSARRWEVVNVENVDIDVQPSNVFSELVLPKEVRETVRALAKAYERQGPGKRLATDLIRGKGLGTIFLLHGPPGVGKTATAESVAEMTNRPLLSLTCGDLGTDGAQVEEKLNKYLKWGLSWGAVVLLDEADVFLEQRDIADVGRNSLVSVFLRALEYYSGFLFLTTNRVNTFDEAFISRIHVALHYKPLGPEERRKIWSNNIKRLEKNGVKVMRSTKDYIEDEVVELDWNGREIRNAFQTATALAQYDADTNEEAIALRTSHIRRVVGLSSQFHKYLASISRGMTPAEIALRKGLRNDLVDAPSKKDTKVQQPRRRYDRHYEDEDDEEQEVDDRKTRKVQNAKSLPRKFYEDEDNTREEEQIASTSQRNIGTPDTDEQAQLERTQKTRPMSQRKNKYEDDEEEELDTRGNQRRADRRTKVSGTKANNYEDHESEDDEEDEHERQILKEAKPRRA